MGDEIAKKFTALSTETIKEQLNIFLRAYRTAEGVDMRKAFLFANYFHLTLGDKTEMDLSNATALMQKTGQVTTPFALKSKLKLLDVDSNGKISCLEFLLLYFEKDVSKLSEDHDCDESVIKDLADAKAAKAANEEQQAKLNAESAEKKTEAEAGGVKAFGANQRVDAIVEELSNLNIGKDTGLKDLNKKLEKAQKARDAAGSDTQRALEEAKLTEFNRDFQPELHGLYPELERDL